MLLMSRGCLGNALPTKMFANFRDAASTCFAQCLSTRAEMSKRFCIERRGGARHCKHAQDERASGNTNQDAVGAVCAGL